MNKKELIEVIRQDLQLTVRETERFINSFMENVMQELEDGGEVRLVGFGTFKTVEKAARKGINPKTLKEMDIPAKKMPKFTAGKKLKERVDK
jgi:DNA-binding protein HU-beta